MLMQEIDGQEISNMEIIAIAVIFILAVAMQGWIFTKYVFRKLDYSCKFSTDKAYEGDSLFLVETVQNRKLLPVPWLKVDIHTSRWLEFARTNSVITRDGRRVSSTFFLRSYQKTTRRWNLKCMKRGVFTIKNVTLIGGDLLRHGTDSIPVTVNTTLTVYPEVINIKEMFSSTRHVFGDMLVRRWIVDDPFIVSGTREYMPSDPMKRIHWPVTAKQGRLMVRKNDFTSRLSITVVLNIQSLEFEYEHVAYRDLIELGIKVAATLIDNSMKTSCPVRFATNACTLDDRNRMVFTGEASGREHVEELMEILAKLELKNVRDFKDFLDIITGKVQNSDVIILTSYTSKVEFDKIRLLKLYNNSVRLVLLNSFVNTDDIPDDIEVFYRTDIDVSTKGWQDNG
jgi:uncharacterized protein (DUF58 family)